MSGQLQRRGVKRGTHYVVAVSGEDSPPSVAPPTAPVRPLPPARPRRETALRGCCVVIGRERSLH